MDEKRALSKLDVHLKLVASLLADIKGVHSKLDATIGALPKLVATVCDT